MRTGRRTSLAMALIAVLLILGSLAMFFLPWLQMDEEKSLVSLDLAKEQVSEAAEGLVEDWEYYAGIQVDRDAVVRVAETVRKGAWSPVDLLYMLGDGKAILSELNEELTPLASQIPEAQEEFQTLQKLENTLGVARWVWIGLLGLCALLALIAVLCVLTDHRGGLIPYLLLSLLMLAAFFGLAYLLNQYLEDEGILLRVKPALFGMISAGLALLAFLVTLLPIGRRSRKSSMPKTAPAAEGWLCPTCGAQRKADQKYCLNCGTPRPDLAGGPVRSSAPAASGSWKCPGCGTLLKADQRFCLYCGTKRPGAESRAAYPQQRPAQTPTPARAPAGWTCPGCGFRLEEQKRFCPRCGSARPMNTQTVAPAPTRASAGWTCPGCGARLQDAQKFCPRCGSARPMNTQAGTPAPTRVPAGWTCPGCGARLQDAQKFCPRCGSARPMNTQTVAPAPTRASAGWTCPGCGAKLKESRNFCTRCGSKRPEKPEPPAAEAAPAPAPRLCPACGFPLGEGMDFCGKCGTRYAEPAPGKHSAPESVSAEPAESEAPTPETEAVGPALQQEKPSEEERFDPGADLSIDELFGPRDASASEGEAEPGFKLPSDEEL